MADRNDKGTLDKTVAVLRHSWVGPFLLGFGVGALLWLGDAFPPL